MKTFTSLAEDLLQLFFPHLCIGCGSDNISNNDYLCAFCFQDLPLTNSAAFDNNPTERIFNGRLPIIAAHSEMYFQKGTIVQELLHQLKYKGKHEIGVFLGEMIGKSIVSSSRFNNIDMIVPLPLHKNKEKKRGYNQSVFIAKGISNITGKPINTQAIKRIKNTQTQTKKKRDERWLNVEDGFAVNTVELNNNKHILLVDDVITTGSSLEACGRCLLSIEGAKLSIASVALALN